MMTMMMMITMTIPMGRDSAQTGIEPFEVLVRSFVIVLALLYLCRNDSGMFFRVVLLSYSSNFCLVISPCSPFSTFVFSA